MCFNLTVVKRRLVVKHLLACCQRAFLLRCIIYELKLSMRACAFGVRDVMKLMGVVILASAPGCEASNLLLFSL